jgi:hypothetical protein
LDEPNFDEGLSFTAFVYYALRSLRVVFKEDLLFQIA